MLFYTPLRAVKRLATKITAKPSAQLSPVRRIERVAPPGGRLVVSMTFDDGPTFARSRPGDGVGITSALMEALEGAGARATFNVIGDTSNNYPDRAGDRGTPLWSGVAFDHYPAFGDDKLAGVANQPALAKRLLEGGHELANHGYTHVAFGPSPVIYGTRRFFPNAQAALADLRKLHEVVQAEHGYTMRLGRPPHYIDRTVDGRDAYWLYGQLGYHYLAASFDGGGWRPSAGDYGRTLKAMVAPLKAAVAADPASLNGQIIFQKDGYNMSLESPVVHALPQQLDILVQAGYAVVPVSELMAMSAVSDVSPDSEPGRAVAKLLRAGRVVAYRDNSYRPGSPVSRGELAVMLLKPGELAARSMRPRFDDVPASHPYYGAIETAARLGLMRGVAMDKFDPGAPVARSALAAALAARSGNPAGSATIGPATVSRAEAAVRLAALLA